jgi:hypothetical protein
MPPGSAALNVRKTARYAGNCRDPLQEAKEAAWLAANRQAYLGQWVALDGDHLLAVRSSAREVFAAIDGYVPTPLVTKIRPAVPFAGW